GHLLRRRARGAPGRRGRRGRTGGREHLLQPPRYRGLHGRGRALHELAHFLELGQNDLALDAELLGELVDAGLACHWTPHLRPGGDPLDLELPGKRCHRWRFIECSYAVDLLLPDGRDRRSPTRSALTQ